MEDDFKLWLEKSFEDNGFSNCSINVIGTTDKTDGYTSTICFVEILLQNKGKENKQIQAIVKVSKYLEQLKAEVPPNFKGEQYFYSTVVPAFSSLIGKKDITYKLDFIPRCFKSVMHNDAEVIVLENLKAQGFKLHDARKPLNLQHLKLSFEAYAKFHALSFALRDQNKSKFEKLFSNYTNYLEIFLSESSMKKMYPNNLEKIYKLLTEMNEHELVKKLKKRLEKGADVIFDEILNAKVEECILVHADTWNNNLMFRYENDDQTPSSVRLLDFQVCILHSPAFDLSCHLYLTGSQEEIAHFDELMKYYYECLSSFLIELGSDPQKLFPFSKLMSHWKKYCAHACLMTLICLKMAVCDVDDAKTFDDLQGQELASLFCRDPKIQDMDMYKNRIYSVAKHFCSICE